MSVRLHNASTESAASRLGYAVIRPRSTQQHEASPRTPRVATRARLATLVRKNSVAIDVELDGSAYGRLAVTPAGPGWKQAADRRSISVTWPEFAALMKRHLA